MRRSAALAVGMGIVMTAAPAAEKDTRVYEMRVYYAAPGKLDDLHARFRDHTIKLFEKHGMTNVGYFVPTEDTKGRTGNPDNKLVYFLAYPSREARDASWKAFVADPAWKAVVTKTEKDGKLVDRVVQRFLTPTDYSPMIKAGGDKAERVFELRTYTTTPGNLPALDARFRDHTMKLFEKHGMTNVIYWHLVPAEKDAERTLVYLLAHKSRDAAKQSWADFRKDPEWVKARTESEQKAGGSLTEKENGVLFEYLKPTDYSPLK